MKMMARLKLLNYEQKGVLYGIQCINMQFILKIKLFLSVPIIEFKL